MTTAVRNLFGNGNQEEIRAAQRRQEAMIDEDRRNLEAVQAGQERARTAGRGLLAYLDMDEEAIATDVGLAQDLGGSWRPRRREAYGAGAGR